MYVGRLIAKSWFAKMCLWLNRGAHYGKKMETKCIGATQISKTHLANYMFDANSQQDLKFSYVAHFWIALLSIIHLLFLMCFYSSKNIGKNMRKKIGKKNHKPPIFSSSFPSFFCIVFFAPFSRKIAILGSFGKTQRDLRPPKIAKNRF